MGLNSLDLGVFKHLKKKSDRVLMWSLGLPLHHELELQTAGLAQIAAVSFLDLTGFFLNLSGLERYSRELEIC
jgi:hypothetical protein